MAGIGGGDCPTTTQALETNNGSSRYTVHDNKHNTQHPQKSANALQVSCSLGSNNPLPFTEC